jgi:hypothetical protein
VLANAARVIATEVTQVTQSIARAGIRLLLARSRAPRM